ncbi:MAG: beta-galactosidase [Bryobacterales bacterium]|nr:beta-galactosidase [Bryobacterales bacterium]
MRTLILGFLPFFAVPLIAAGLGRWTAGQPPKAEGLSLVRGPDADYRIVRAGQESVAAIVPVRDYYRRAGFLVRVEKSVSGPVWLLVDYLDRGYNLVQVSAPVRESWGIARLNTGRFRTAWFALEKAPAEIRIHGVEQIRSLALSDAEPPRTPIPNVQPALKLKRPMDLVMTAGADARTPDGLPQSLAAMRQMIPELKALGFNGVESYVKWNFVERSPGVYDWSFYDAIVDELEKHGMKWFPLLIVGSAYALPEWFYKSGELDGYVCLEHGIEIEIPTIFNDKQVKYVRRFLSEFGRHYGKRKALLGVRLGPTANYGEAQYPATGAWGYRWGSLHTHLGYWAGDPDATLVFRNWVRLRYKTLEALNEAWFTRYGSFDEVKTFLPDVAQSPRMRVDFCTWYMDAMSEWCEKWAVWAREAMPHTPIYQSSGGWGAVPIGTDYSAQARSMTKVKGGIRLTNENDNYLNNFAATRMAASAARHYGIRLGFEPAGFASARGVMGRLFNSFVNGADHLFYYDGNFFTNDQATRLWLRHAPLLDRRERLTPEIAVFYPDTANKLSDEVLRHRLASAFFERVHAFRRVTDYDYAGEQTILDGALEHYKVLVFLWGRVAEKAVIERIDRWVQAGGTVLYPERQQQREGILGTVEGDMSIAQAWQQGRTGKGKVIFFQGYAEPPGYYIQWLRDTLPALPQLSPPLRRALRIQRGPEVFFSLASGGAVALLNYDDRPATVRFPEGKTVVVGPYHIAVE